MTPAEILRAAKAKIEKPENWCQGAGARNRNGTHTMLEAKDACQWCASAATSVVCPPGSYDAMCKADDYLAGVAASLGFSRVHHLNDTTDHATVLAAFDRAIALAEAEQAKAGQG